MGMSLRIAALASALMLSAVIAPTAQSQNMDEEIKSLKEKLATLENAQIEMKKEATAAAAALPTFSYRPGNGLNIEAADKSWSFRAALESHFRMNFLSGKDEIGRTNGEIEGRRFRPEFYYCLNNCLWELDARLDLDGFGGGPVNATGDEFNSIMQRAALH